jgi:hypothetical protein
LSPVLSIPPAADRQQDVQYTPDPREPEMAQYVFLLYDNEDWFDNLTPEEWQQAMKLHGAFTEAVEKAGARILGGEALERSTTASTVRQREGAEPLVTDGPFIETKEALGGYYVIEARDLDQALELAKVCPSGNVEVRPIMDTSSDTEPPA